MTNYTYLIIVVMTRIGGDDSKPSNFVHNPILILLTLIFFANFCTINNRDIYVIFYIINVKNNNNTFMILCFKSRVDDLRTVDKTRIYIRYV